MYPANTKVHLVGTSWLGCWMLLAPWLHILCTTHTTHASFRISFLCCEGNLRGLFRIGEIPTSAHAVTHVFQWNLSCPSVISGALSSRGSEETFWSSCGRHNAVVGGLRRLLVTSMTSSWVVPPPKVVFFRDAPGAEHPERLYFSSAEWEIGSSQRGVFNRVWRRIRRDRLLRSRLGAWRKRSSWSTTPSQEGRNVGGSRKAPSVSTWPIHPRAGAYEWVVHGQWGKDGACSLRGSKDPCGHSWRSDSMMAAT